MGEAGLLSIAFDPEFARNGRFYAYFVEIGTLDSVIARYQPFCDAVYECRNLRQLRAFVEDLD